MLDLNKLTQIGATSKAIIFIVGVVGMFTSAFVAIALLCRIIVLMLQVILSSVQEFMRLYDLQIPVIQLFLLFALICCAVFVLSQMLRFIRLHLEYAQAQRLAELIYAEMMARRWNYAAI